MTAAAIALILALAAGCAPGGGMTETARLSLDQPQRELSAPFTAAAAASSLQSSSPRAVTVVVDRIDNPAARAFTIAVDLRSPGRAPVRLGVVSPFPADKPGRYVLTLKGGTKPAPDARVHLTLRPLNPAERGDIAVDLSVIAGAAPSRR